MTGLLETWEGRGPEKWARRLGVATTEFHARIGSTNDRAAALVREGCSVPALVVADRQTAGRGRRGRRWSSDTPLGLWFTFVGGPGEVVGAGASVFPLRVGLAVAKGLESAGGDPVDSVPGRSTSPPSPERRLPALRVQVKWPNDLFVNGRKIGGVLCEQVRGHVLVGVGLNLNQSGSELPSGLKVMPTSLLIETGRRTPRGRVLGAVRDALEAVRKPSTSPVNLGEGIPPDELEELNARSPLRGRRLSAEGVVRYPSGRLRAVKAFSVLIGDLLQDGSLEVRNGLGPRLRLIAGSIGRRG